MTDKKDNNETIQTDKTEIQAKIFLVCECEHPALKVKFQKRFNIDRLPSYAVISQFSNEAAITVNIWTKSEKTAKRVAKRCATVGTSKLVRLQNPEACNSFKNVVVVPVKVHENPDHEINEELTEDRAWVAINRAAVRAELAESAEETKEA